MQDQIPIFTLDQDWLWCQTWCSDESLARAKTSQSASGPVDIEKLTSLFSRSVSESHDGEFIIPVSPRTRAVADASM